MPHVAVVGGGIAGLVCATELAQQGCRVQVFDMGRHNPGGRMSTRRTVWKDMHFDHGCQQFTATDERVLALFNQWEEKGVIGQWQGTSGRYNASTGVFVHSEEAEGSADSFFGHLGPGPKWVGVPSMDAICAHLAKQLEAAKQGDHQAVNLGVKVQKAGLSPGGKWLLEGDIQRRIHTSSDRGGNPPHTPWNLGVFDGLVLADAMVARPGAPGLVAISGADLSPMMARLQAVGSVPLFSLLLVVDSATPLVAFEAASFVASPAIRWLALDTSKPGRERADTLQCWVAITTPEFSEELLGRQSPEAPLPPQTPEYLASIAPRIWEALVSTLQPALKGQPLPEPLYMQCHRWGAALPARPLGEACLADSNRVVACGDFCLGGGVENAVLSGLAAAEKLRGMLPS